MPVPTIRLTKLVSGKSPLDSIPGGYPICMKLVEKEDDSMIMVHAEILAILRIISVAIYIEDNIGVGRKCQSLLNHVNLFQPFFDPPELDWIVYFGVRNDSLT